MVFINGIPDNSTDILLLVLDSEGKTVISQKNSEQVNISNLANGIYILNILKNNSIVFTQKIIKITN
jgi:hypothetical protein